MYFHWFLILVIGNCVFSFPADSNLEKCWTHCEEKHGTCHEVEYETTHGGCTIECTCDGETEIINEENFKKVGKKKVCFDGEAFHVADERDGIIGLQEGDNPCDVTYYDRETQEEIEDSESYTDGKKCYDKENDCEGKCSDRVCISDDESYGNSEDDESHDSDHDDENHGDGDDDDDENGDDDGMSRTGEKKSSDDDGAKQDSDNKENKTTDIKEVDGKKTRYWRSRRWSY